MTTTRANPDILCSSVNNITKSGIIIMSTTTTTAKPSLGFLLFLLVSLVATWCSHHHPIMMVAHAFSPNPMRLKTVARGSSTTTRLFDAAEDDDDTTEPSSSKTSSSSSLEEKMKTWEASKEEVQAATLGGIVPGGSRSNNDTDAFDVGLYVAFPLMVLASLAVVVFPLLMGNIDTSSVGPPPTS